MPAPVLRREAVLARTGFSTATLYRKMGKGTFPRPIQISDGLVAWPEDEIEQWLANRIRSTGGKPRKAA